MVKLNVGAQSVRNTQKKYRIAPYIFNKNKKIADFVSYFSININNIVA